MLNKKAKEALDRQRHKDRLKSKRREEPVLDRGQGELIEKPSILIVCEGENTEPSYFNQFRLSSATVKSIGEGYNTISLVDRAAEISSRKEYDQVWCVFDKDDFKDNDFNNAINIAESHGFGVAYSNQAFEYWLILHFDDHQGGGMHRRDYNKKINDLLRPFGLTYDGNGSKVVDEEFFEILDGTDEATQRKRVELAITRAKRNNDLHNHSSPAKRESSTTVFKLVEELLKYL